MPDIVCVGNPRYLQGATFFEQSVSWQVDNASTPGYIVQHISRNEKWTSVHNNPIVAPNEYWECWKVEVAHGHVQRIHPAIEGVHDVFRVSGDETIINYRTGPVWFPRKRKSGLNTGGTEGKWKIRGRVYWVPEAQFDERGWKRSRDADTGAPLGDVPGAVKEAGRLLSRFEKPTRGDGLRPRGELGRILLIRTHAGEWNFKLPEAQCYHRERDWPDMKTNGFWSTRKTENREGKAS
jgi:hypothetical protein